ncbi:DeoR/GlpR transcriptional regulator [Mariniphaga sediminis]|jgi:DeoR family fructose operon transcriptional repressor|uniref:DeoR/GlpR transcriptional regulator n=1 Tax=Mariniphaga sediminis TaxID=1628158 RepID=A0A399DA26_9BACT|nr:DeoR/GlpR family DNA-binding transcription regulator [Mariniphaga sediminis]RIH67071.1 DeoR/GlpR transcriptional regulator [Mariniphaga sediminis]
MKSKRVKTTTPEIRKRIILNLLKDNDVVSIQEIFKECNASEITIRRDLSELEEKGLLIRTHGGAIKKDAAEHLFTFNNKMRQNQENKEYICKVASNYINDNDIIFIDCGSTLSFLSKYISKKESLTVITNSLPIVSELINHVNIKLILVGGEVVNERKAVYGPATERSILQYHADKAFIGADGISLSKGLTSYDEKEAAITLKMAENSDEVFLLCDSTKVEKNSFVRFAPHTVLDYVITDKNLDSRYISKYQKNNIKLINE